MSTKKHYFIAALVLTGCSDNMTSEPNIEPDAGMSIPDTATSATATSATIDPDALTAAVIVMAVGDSLTLGAPGLDGGYRAPLNVAMPRLSFVGRNFSNGYHEGYSGKTIDEIRTLVMPIIDTYKPQVILLMAGTNDITTNTDVAAITADYVSLAQEFKSHASVQRVVVGNVPWRAGTLRDETIAYNAGLAAAFASAGSGIDEHDMCSEIAFPADFADSTHPNDAGYAKEAAAWQVAIASGSLP